MKLLKSTNFPYAYRRHAKLRAPDAAVRTLAISTVLVAPKAEYLVLIGVPFTIHPVYCGNALSLRRNEKEDGIAAAVVAADGVSSRTCFSSASAAPWASDGCSTAPRSSTRKRELEGYICPFPLEGRKQNGLDSRIDKLREK
ncbi:hypothetical protein AYL99_11607 [Fonsecaea erecta]|uniref:Uncharacterized protein n=1 Tax=Fonsecaea erecta TaxID=1367422 RepID=A0A178Z4F3_9EURO|nr:hypothetical protein AYL99_11607 [Fonsecaea erecta]OAP54073.1 hypothetical protein AYL99_11607 [Fonsecaea erecta]